MEVMLQVELVQVFPSTSCQEEHPPPLPVIIWKSIHLQQEIICVETLTLQETKGHLMTPSQGPGEAGLQRAPSD